MMKPSNRLFARMLLAAGIAGILPAQASNLSVNLGLGFTNTPDEPGFENVLVTNGVFGPQSGLATINGVTIDLDQIGTNETMRSIDRGDPGSYSGTLGTLTNTWVGTQNPGDSLLIILSGVTAGAHEWTSYHLDEGNQTGMVDITVSVDGGATYGPASSFDVWDTTSQGIPGAPADFTFTTTFTATGTDDVIIQLTPTIPGGTTDFTVTNGFKIEELADLDNDTLVDSWEQSFVGNLTDLNGLLPAGSGPGSNTGDFDGDGLSDADEQSSGTEPNNSDTDDDGLQDGVETNTGFYSSPTDTGTNPLVKDSDGDGLEDGAEVITHMTDPNDSDSDNDFMPDGWEVDNGLNPTDPNDGFDDADLDGVNNENEFFNGTDPNDDDTDDDNLKDGVETNSFFYTSPSDTGTDPTIPDTDGDGLDDGVEVITTLTDPTNTDSDFDGDADGKEVLAGSDPNDFNDLADADLDGYSKQRELDAGTDPNDDLSYPQPPAGALFVDFNSNQDEGGDSAGEPDPKLSVANHNQFGYQSYHANHEVAAEFVTADYTAFGTTVSFTPSWPSTTDNRVMQSIDRTNQDETGIVLGGFDGNWQGDMINLLTDWIGADTRTINGGNGNYDGTTGIPTTMEFRLSGLPAGTYNYRSYQHDTEHIWASFQVEVSTDGGVTFGPIETGMMTDSTPAGTPASPQVYRGAGDPGLPNPLGSLDPADLPSTYNTSFTASGSDDVVIRYTCLSDTAVHRQLVGVNGFELTSATFVPTSVLLTDVNFNGAVFDVTGEGFDTDTFYQLKKSTNGTTFTNVGSAFQPASSTHTQPDNAPSGSFALYQFFEAAP